MSFILNRKLNNDTLTFDLVNDKKDIKISLANAIRRTIISDIQVYAIDDKTVVFHENNSVLNNEFLKHRLSLIPINSNLEGVDYDNLLTSLDTNYTSNKSQIYTTCLVYGTKCQEEIIDEDSLKEYGVHFFSKSIIRNPTHLETKDSIVGVEVYLKSIQTFDPKYMIQNI